MPDENQNEVNAQSQVKVQTRGIKESSESETVTIIDPHTRLLHGRRQIFTNYEQITDDNVIEVLNKALMVHFRNRADEEYLERYIRGIQPILARVKDVNENICNKIVINRANEIVTFKTANFVGEPIQFVSRGSKAGVPEKIERLNSMMLSEGKPSKDIELAYKMFTDGVSYRLILRDKAEDVANGDLLDEAPFEIYVPDPRNTFVVRVNNVKKRPIMGVTYVFLDDAESQVQYTVYTENVTYTIEGSAVTASKITSKTVHNFGMLNLIEYPCNSLYMGAFEIVIGLLDAINTTESNRLDGVEQFIQAIMVLQGVDMTREQFLELKDLGAIKIPGEMNGQGAPKIYYLNEQLDQSQTQTLIDNMYQEVLQIVGMPSQGNANTSDSSNNGAIIMKNGWWNAESRARETTGQWRAAETEFLKIVLKICKDANVTDLDGLSVSDIEVKFHRENYEDLLVKTQSFTTLRGAGCAPLQSFKLSKLGTDYESEASQYEKYQIEQDKKEEASVQRQLDIEMQRMAMVNANGESQE